MNLFNQVPSNFFGILASQNKEIYMKALLTLYQVFQTDWSIKRSELVIYLIDQLDDMIIAYNLDEDEIEEVKSKTSSAYAHLILRKLRNTGWIEFEMGLEDFQEYVSIPDYAYKIIEVLHTIASGDVDAEYNRYVYSTYSVLRLSNEDGENYKTAIDSAFEQTKGLFDKLKMLFNNIRRYHKQLADHSEMNIILLEHFDEFKENLSDKIYYPIKTFDSVHRFKTPILVVLKDWLYSDEIMEKLSEEAWQREKGKKSIIESTFKMEIIEESKEKLVKIIDIYEHMDALLNEIDKKNAEYTKATFERIDFLLNTDRSVKGKVRELIKALSTDKSEIWNDRITDALSLSTQEIVDESSLYSARQARKRISVKRERIRRDVDREKVLSEVSAFKESVKEAYSKKKIQHYMLALLEENMSIESRMIPVEKDEDYVRTILGILDHDDKKSQYQVEFKKGEVDKQQYKIPDFVLNRKVEK